MLFQDRVVIIVDLVFEDSFYFCFYVGLNGIILQIGFLYFFNFCKDLVFICIFILRNKGVLNFKFLLCFLVGNKVEGIDRGVFCIVNDVKYVVYCFNIVIGLKGKGLVDKIIREGWDRVLLC